MTTRSLVASARTLRETPRPMAVKPTKTLAHVLALAHHALSMTQAELAEALGASRRTASRWAAGHSNPSEQQITQLARMLFPVDRSLAMDAAAHAHETLESLGLERPVPTHPIAPVLVERKTPVEVLVDAVICAAAERVDTTPRAVREVLHAALRRMRELEIGADDVERTLAARADVRPDAKPTPSKPSQK